MINDVFFLLFTHPTLTVLLLLFVAFIASIISVLSLELAAHLVRCAKVRRGARLYRGYDVICEAEKVARLAQETKKVED